MFVDRWTGVAAALLMQLCPGSVYSFGSYSQEIRLSLGIKRQGTLDVVSSVGNVGLYLGLPAGLFVDRFGPQLTALIGSAVCSIGYFLAYSSTASFLPKSTAMVAASYFIAWHGGAWLDTAAVQATVKNFPLNKGVLLGLIKSFFGLSGSIVAQIYSGMFVSDSQRPGGHLSNSTMDKGCSPRDHHRERRASDPPHAVMTEKEGPVSILLFLSISIACIGCISAFFLRLSSPSQRALPLAAKGRRKVFFGYSVVTILAAYIAGISISETISGAHPKSLTIVMLLLMLPLLAIPCGKSGDKEGDGNEDEKNSQSQVEFLVSSEDGTNALELSMRENLTVLETVRKKEFALLFFAQFVGTGAGLLTINNIGQIFESLGGQKGGAVEYVSMLGVANALGRMLGGWLSDIIASRPACFGVSLICMAIGQFTIAFSRLGWSLQLGLVLTDYNEIYDDDDDDDDDNADADVGGD
eukprot:g4732.t1